MLPHALNCRPDCTPLVSPGGIEHLVEDMTAIVSADVTLATLQATLAGTGQWLPIDGDETATLGQLVSLNSTGPLRLGYGAWRDLLLGVQFRNGRGELITAGGKTVKNVAGYDLTKLMVGQAGQLGQLVTIVTRIYRRPAAALVARWTIGDGEAITGRVNTLLAGPLRPAWMLISGDELHCGYLGDEPAIAFYNEQLAQMPGARIERRSVEADMAERAEHWRWPGNGPAARLSVPPAQVRRIMQQAGATAADPVHGIVLVHGRDRAEIERIGARGLFWDGSAMSPLHLRPAEAAMAERLKAAFS